MANKVQPGDKLTTSPLNEAAFVNHLIDLVNHWQQGKLLNKPQSANTHGDDNNIIKVRNDTGAALAMGEAFKIGGYLLGAKYPKRRWFEALEIDTEFDPHIAVAAEPIPEDKIGRAYIAGMVPVKYTGTAPTPGDWMGPKPGQATLEKGYPACIRVENVTDSGTPKLLLGTLSPITALLCKATATNAAGTLATDTSDYKIQQGTAGSEADAGFTTQPAIYSRGDTVINEFFTAVWKNNTWYAELDDNRWLGKADSAITAGSSGTISLWTGTPGSESDSTDNVSSVRNRTSVDVPSGGWVVISRVNGKLYLEPWSC